MSIRIKNLDSFFSLLNVTEIVYCLVEAEDNTAEMLVQPQYNESFYRFMNSNGFENIGSEYPGYEFIYGLVPDVKWTNDEITIHSSCQMYCFSMSNIHKYILPVDKSIQESIWQARVWDEIHHWWRLAEEDYLLYSIVKCVFNSRIFSSKNIKKIREKKSVISDSLIRKLNKVFFRFTPKLVELINDDNYDNIIHAYITFKDY